MIDNNTNNNNFGLPMPIILVGYVSVYRTTRRHNSAVIPSLQEAPSPGTVSVHEIHPSRVLLAAVIAFSVCWLCAIIIIMLERVAKLDAYVFPHFGESAAFSSWINPIINGVMSMRNEFRKSLHSRIEN